MIADKYLFDETIKPWLNKNKFNLSLELHNSSPDPNNKNTPQTVETIELEENNNIYLLLYYRFDNCINAQGNQKKL